nr:MAG: putative RNA-dependent RNA polymerase [Picobirnavirus sp.]
MATKKNSDEAYVKGAHFEENYFDNCFDLPNPGLRAYFAHVESGNDEEYRTPFYKGKDLNQILEGWEPTLNEIRDEWPSLLEFENDLREKVGPMSIMKPLAQRLDDIDSYYESILQDSVPISPAAVDAVCDWLKPLRGLRLRSEDHTVDIMKKSTNSGSPFFTKRRNVTDKTIPAKAWLSLVDESGIPDSKYNYKDNRSGIPVVSQALNGSFKRNWYGCAVLGWRGQEGGPTVDDVKQRVVWMFPYAVNIQELRFYQPFIEACQRFNLVPAWVSMDAVDREITELFDSKSPDDLIVCTDFSKFDQHFNVDMQLCADEVFSRLLTRTRESDEWLGRVFPIKYEIPLAYNWKKVRFGRHGMGSGSGGTNADETVVHKALQFEAAISAKATLNPHSMCLGDDGLLSYPGITVDDVVRTYSSHGQEMNPDKQYASKQDCVYLRRWHHKDYRPNGVCAGVYSTYRALGRLAEQERFYDSEKWGPRMVALRQLSILENVKYHPLREKFVAYCMKGDKYRLGLDLPGFLDNIEREAKEAIEYMPDFLGYTKSLQFESNSSRVRTGISDWWVVQYLKSMA